jgi:hypothetical protein
MGSSASCEYMPHDVEIIAVIEVVHEILIGRGKA